MQDVDHSRMHLQAVLSCDFCFWSPFGRINVVQIVYWLSVCLCHSLRWSPKVRFAAIDWIRYRWILEGQVSFKIIYTLQFIQFWIHFLLFVFAHSIRDSMEEENHIFIHFAVLFDLCGEHMLFAFSRKCLNREFLQTYNFFKLFLERYISSKIYHRGASKHAYD